MSLTSQKKINWKRFITYDSLANNLNDRIRFVLTFLTISIGVIFLGDLFNHLSFKTTGVLLVICGSLGIVATILIPIIAYEPKSRY